MDTDDSADLIAILGLAGAGLALMIVGSLDLSGVAVVLAVFIPALAAGCVALAAAVIRWRHATSRPVADFDDRAAHRDGGDSTRRCHA